MSVNRIVPTLLVSALALCMTATPAKAQTLPNTGVLIDSIDLSPGGAFEIVDGVLQLTEGTVATVTGTIGGLPFTTTITDFALQLEDTPEGVCSILHLELAPIHLALLGVFVDTSPICLDLTAMEGGGLLGDLLCGLAGGAPISLPGITPADAQQALFQGGALAAGVQEILNQALARAEQTAEEDICRGDFPILNLAVGPIDLNLLGLMVALDDCDEGPVLVCVSASRGQGLLGDLLVGLLGGGLLGNLDLGQLSDLLGGILDTVGDALNGLNPPAKAVNQLVAEVGRALSDGNVTGNEVDRVAKHAAKIARKS